jgi:predicted metalloprotease
MRWKDLRRSENVRDVRGEEGGGGMRARMPISLGRGGALAGVAVLVIAYLIGGPEAVQNLLEGGGGDAPTAEQGSPLTANDEASQFVAAILGSTEDVWSEIFASSGRRYEAPELTLFGGAVQSACGYASTAAGPFYCPSDHRVYLDTAFFADLARLGGPGDFAQAYVIGHEVGHHVQNLLGNMRAAANAGATGASGGQVALELQADCYAGVWAHHANQRNHVLEPGDVEEGIAAAEAIGDDTLQRNAGRRVTPDSFTHGTSEQRAHWLGVGLKSGDPQACDTFRDLR